MPTKIVLVQKNVIAILYFYWTRQLFDDNSLDSVKKFSTHGNGQILKKCLQIISIERPTVGAKCYLLIFCVGFLKHNEKDNNKPMKRTFLRKKFYGLNVFKVNIYYAILLEITWQVTTEI